MAGVQIDLTLLVESEGRIAIDSQHMCGAGGGYDVVRDDFDLLR
jgi:hypothetical protein